MTRPTDSERDLNERELLADRHDRDREREPAFAPRARQDLRARRAFQAGVLDTVNRHLDTTPLRLSCPLCKGAVYAPADSDKERIDCSWCGAVLVTRRGIEGVAVVELDVAPGQERIAAALAVSSAEAAPVPDWIDRVLDAVDRGEGDKP